VRRVNENFTALYSPPFKVPVSSGFLNLDGFWAPSELVMPLNGTQEKEEEKVATTGNSSISSSSSSSGTLGRIRSFPSFVFLFHLPPRRSR